MSTFHYDNGKTETAINTHLWLPVALFAFFVLLSAFGIREQAIWVAIGFAAAALLPLFIFLTSPMYYVFSEESVEIIYLWGQKEKIKWSSVRNITLLGSWIIRTGSTPHYHFAYPTRKKRAFFICGEISKTPKTKKLIRKYYKKKIL